MFGDDLMNKIPIETKVDQYGFYEISCPLFKGCHTYGATYDEALIYFKEIVELCLEESVGEYIN